MRQFVSLCVTTLEERLAPAGLLPRAVLATTAHIAPVVAQPGDDVVLSQLSVGRTGNGIAVPLRTMSLPALAGVVLADAAPRLKADLVAPSGDFETDLGTGVVVGNAYRFDLGIAGVLANHRRVPLRVVANIIDEPVGDCIGVGKPSFTVQYQQWFRPVRVVQRGPANPLHIIDQLQAGAGLFIAKHVPIAPQHLLAGASNSPIARYTFTAQGGDVTITRLAARATGLGSLDRFDLFFGGATTPFASATVAGVGSGFGDVAASGFSLTVPDGQTITIDVRPRLRTDEAGAVSGDMISFDLLADDRSVQAYANGELLQLGDADTIIEDEVFINRVTPGVSSDLVSGPFEVVLARVSDITNANPASDDTSVPTGLSDVGQFRFSADPNGNARYGLNKVAIDALSIMVSAQNVQLGSSVTLFNKADMTQQVSGTLVPVTGGFMVHFSNLASSFINTQLNSGENQTFVLRVDVLNPHVSSSQSSLLQCSLNPLDVTWIDQDALTAVSHEGILQPSGIVRSTRYTS